MRSARSRPPRISYANVTATLALFIALGGSAWAVQANSIGSKELQRNAVKKKHVQKNAIASKELRRNAVKKRHIRRNSVASKELRRNAVKSKHVKDGTLLSADFKPGELLAGAPGGEGPAGPKGAKGDQGPAGPKGAKGDRGATGAKGDQGPAGLQGDTGDQGPAGLKGDKGDTGDQGPAGLNGAKGDPGTAKAFAYVRPSPLEIDRGSGFTAVSTPITGIYCLTAPGLDPATSVVQVTVEWRHSFANDLLAYWDVSSSDCSADQFEVRTHDTNGTLRDDIAFVIAVL